MNKIKAILLEGGKSKEIMLSKDSKQNVKETRDILGIGHMPEYLSFGDVYIMLWQEDFEEEISMQLTCTAGFSYPIFIRSKVVILHEDSLNGELIDVDMEELKTYFKTNGDIWALMKFD